jgi:hypothetical protein
MVFDNRPLRGVSGEKGEEVKDVKVLKDGSLCAIKYKRFHNTRHTITFGILS